MNQHVLYTTDGSNPDTHGTWFESKILIDSDSIAPPEIQGIATTTREGPWQLSLLE